MAILDANGQPFEQSTLREPQTAQLGWLHREIAQHQARGLTPAKLNRILTDAEHGNLIAQHELFQDMEERDAHLFSEMDKRKRAVYKLDWAIKPPRNPSKQEEEWAAYAQELISDMPDFEDALRDALDAIGHGFSPLEMEWRRLGSDWTVASLTHRPQTWFQTDIETRTILRLRDMSATGADLRPFGWVVHTHQAKSGYLARAGLHRILVWPFLFKTYAIGDLAEFIEIYGLPLRLGKYPVSATEDDRMTLLQAVMGIGHNAAGIIPAGMTIDFVEAAKGQSDPFQLLLSWAEKSESKAIVGQTLSADTGATGMGSGVADLHGEVRQDIRDSDCKQLAGTLTRQLVYPILAINKGLADPRRCPRFVFDVQEAEDIKTYSEALPPLVQLGMRITPEWAHDKLRIPMAEDGEDVLTFNAGSGQSDPNAEPGAQPGQPGGKPTGKPGQPPAPKPKVKKVAAGDEGMPLQQAIRMAVLAGGPGKPASGGKSGQESFADQEALDGALVTLASASLQEQAERMLAPAILALQNAGSYEAALALLSNEVPLVDTEALGEALARAVFAVEAHGYASLREEIAGETGGQS